MIDWERIAELQEEVGEDDFGEVLEIFFSEVEEAMETLPGASADDLAASLHFLKGAALNIGMETMSQQCREAEEALKSDPSFSVDTEALQATLAQSQDELRELMSG